MIPALCGVLSYLALGVLGFVVPRPRVLSAMAWAAGVASLLLWLPGFGPTELGIGPAAIVWAGDGLASSLWALALLLHLVLLTRRAPSPKGFWPLTTLLIGSTMALTLSQDIFNLYVALELSSLISFLLVGLEGEPGQIWASLRYLVLISAGMVIFLLGIGLYYWEVGELSLVGEVPPGDSLALRIGLGLLVAGAAVKGGIFPFSLWLPGAHGRAPDPVSALLSGLVVKGGIVVLARLSRLYPLGELFIALGLVTGLSGIAYALWERDLKLFLAYSTLSQLGYPLIAFGIGAWEAGVAYCVAHGILKSLLFLGAGEAIRRGKRTFQEIGGPLPPGAHLGLGVGAAAIAGLPPLLGYTAKAAVSAGAPGWLEVPLFLLAVGTAASFAKVLPLLRRGIEPGARLEPGIALLAAVTLAAGTSGMAIWSGLPWALHALKSMIAIALGLLFHAVTGRWRPNLPGLGLDRSLLLLLGAGTAVLWYLILAPTAP